MDKVVGQFDELKFLDPTCGSASFLLAIIKRIRANSQLSSGELLERIIQNVWGFDLNPLAVQTARVNYLIAISDLIAEVPGINIEIPILNKYGKVNTTYILLKITLINTVKQQ